MKKRFASQMCLFAVLMIAATGLQAQTYTSLYNYPETDTGNSGILSPGLMSQGQDGQLYMTDASNGSANSGTVFKMSTSGLPTTLYTFCSPDFLRRRLVPLRWSNARLRRELPRHHTQRRRQRRRHSL